MRAGFVERFAGTRAYATIEELCADKEVDAVWVATPNNTIATTRSQRCSAGKHVLVENRWR